MKIASAANVGISEECRLRNVRKVEWSDRVPAAVGRDAGHAATFSASAWAGGFCCPGAPQEGSRCPVDAWRLDQHDDDDDEGEDDRLLGGRHAKEEDGGVEGLNDEHADHGARDAELAAQQGSAAEHDGQDRVELDQLAGGVRVGGHDVGAVDDAGDAREGRAGDVGAEYDPARSDAREPARLRVDADGLGEHPERCSALDECHDRDRHDRDDERKGDEHEVAAGDVLERPADDRGDEAPGDQQGNPAPGHHQHQSRDDGLDLQDRDEEAVPDPENEGECDACGHRQEHGSDVPWVGRAIDDRQGDRTGDRHDRADRQVDAAGGDDQGHPEGDQHQRCALAEDVDGRSVELPVSAR